MITIATATAFATTYGPVIFGVLGCILGAAALIAAKTKTTVDDEVVAKAIAALKKAEEITGIKPVDAPKV